MAEATRQSAQHERLTGEQMTFFETVSLHNEGRQIHEGVVALAHVLQTSVIGSRARHSRSTRSSESQLRSTMMEETTKTSPSSSQPASRSKTLKSSSDSRGHVSHWSLWTYFLMKATIRVGTCAPCMLVQGNGTRSMKNVAAWNEFEAWRQSAHERRSDDKARGGSAMGSAENEFQDKFTEWESVIEEWESHSQEGVFDSVKSAVRAERAPKAVSDHVRLNAAGRLTSAQLTTRWARTQDQHPWMCALK